MSAHNKNNEKMPNSTVPATINVKQKDAQMKQEQRKNYSSIHRNRQYLEKVLEMRCRKAKSFVLSCY